jgi:hypothetical protein
MAKAICSSGTTVAVMPSSASVGNHFGSSSSRSMMSHTALAAAAFSDAVIRQLHARIHILTSNSVIDSVAVKLSTNQQIGDAFDGAIGAPRRRRAWPATKTMLRRRRTQGTTRKAASGRCRNQHSPC